MSKGTLSILVSTSAICGMALQGAAQAAAIKLPNHVAPPSGTGIVGTWLTSYDGGVHNAFTQWHRGGTATQAVDFAAKTGNVQLGDWKANGDGTVSLYLIGWSFNARGNTLTGYFTKTETDTLSSNSYSGNFEVTFYDLQGNTLFQHDGTLTAARVN
jgi:hypothetical protein